MKRSSLTFIYVITAIVIGVIFLRFNPKAVLVIPEYIPSETLCVSASAVSEKERQETCYGVVSEEVGFPFRTNDTYHSSFEKLALSAINFVVGLFATATIIFSINRMRHFIKRNGN